MIELNLDCVTHILCHLDKSKAYWSNIKLTCKKFLLASKIAFDPSFEQNFLLQWGFKNGKNAMILELLQDKRVQKSGGIFLAISMCCQIGKLNLLKEIMENPNIKVTPYDLSQSLRFAVYNSHLRVVKELLKNKNCDPSMDRNDCIILASLNGSLPIVRELLADKRVDPSDQKNMAICMAIRVENTQVVEELKKDPRVVEDYSTFIYRSESDGVLYDIISHYLQYTRSQRIMGSFEIYELPKIVPPSRFPRNTPRGYASDIVLCEEPIPEGNYTVVFPE